MTPLGLIKLAVPLLLLVILAVVIISPGARYLLQALEPFGFIREHPGGALPNMAANLLLLCAAYQVWRRGMPAGQEVCRSGQRYGNRRHRRRSPGEFTGAAADYYFVNVGTWTAIVFVCAYGAAFFERLFSNPFAPGFIVVAISARCACDEEKRESAYRLGALFAELQARVRLVTGESAGRGDNDRSTPCCNSDAGTSGPLRACKRNQADAGSAGQRRHCWRLGIA